MAGYNDKESKDYLVIDNEIRDGRLKNLYLLYGAESYLLYTYRDKLLRAMDAENPDNSINYNVFTGQVDENEIISIAETLPFFAEYRTILVQDSGFFKSAPVRLADFLNNELPETTRIIFVESENVSKDTSGKEESKQVDKRGKMYKAVKKSGTVAEMSRQSDDMLKKWIAGRLLKKDDKVMTGRTLDYYLAKIGNDMSNISTETEKLITYTMGRSEITIEDIDTIVTTRLQDKVFDMITAMALKDQKKALQLYYDMISLKVPVQKILYNITNQYNYMLMAKELQAHNGSLQTIAGRMPARQNELWKVERLLKQSKGYSVKQLKNIVSFCVLTDEKIKTGRIGDRLALEMLIVRCSL